MALAYSRPSYSFAYFCFPDTQYLDPTAHSASLGNNIILAFSVLVRWSARMYFWSLDFFRTLDQSLPLFLGVL